jgi:hypothetical protein
VTHRERIRGEPEQRDGSEQPAEEEQRDERLAVAVDELG